MGSEIVQSVPQRSHKDGENWVALKEQCLQAFQSGLLPRSVDTPQKAITIALMGRELGLSPMNALMGLYVVNGMVALRGSLMLRLIYERVPGAKITILTPPEKSDQECEVELQRPGGNPQRFKYTLDDAKRGGFGNKPIWQQHPATMLRWAAIRTGARVVFADALAGCYMEDEIPELDMKSHESSSPKPDAPPNATAVSGSHLPPSRSDSEPARTSPTEKQLKRLFAIARKAGWPNGAVKSYMRTYFKKESSKDLTWKEYELLCQEIERNPIVEASPLAAEFAPPPDDERLPFERES